MLTNEEIYGAIKQAQTYGGNSFFSQMRNAGAGLKALNEMKGSLTDEQIAKYGSGLKAKMAQGAVGAAGSALSGLSSIVGISKDMASLGDTSAQENMIDSMNSMGRGDYGSFDQITSDYGGLQNMQPDLDYDTIRGGSTGERIGGTISSTLAGAAAGAQVGGVWGAVGGAVLGLGAGIGSWLTGNAKAKTKQSILQSQTDAARDIADTRLATAVDSLAESNYMNDYANRAAAGGRIERRATSMRTFADAIMNRQKVSDRTHSAGIVRRHGEGGTIIRIKR